MKNKKKLKEFLPAIGAILVIGCTVGMIIHWVFIHPQTDVWWFLGTPHRVWKPIDYGFLAGMVVGTFLTFLCD